MPARFGGVGVTQKGRPQCKDIPDEVILLACDAYHRELSTWRHGAYVRAVDNQHVTGEPMTPDERLSHLWPAKVILAKMERMAERGQLEYGVSLRTAWRKQ